MSGFSLPNLSISIHALLTESDTVLLIQLTRKQEFLSTLSLRRATPRLYSTLDCGSISIHALLTESDGTVSRLHSNNVYFYPRSPYGERRDVKYKRDQTILFLSTLSLRRATFRKLVNPATTRISIHALLTESDVSPDASSTQCRLFLSTLSLRRATVFIIIFNASCTFLSTLSLRRATT